MRRRRPARRLAPELGPELGPELARGHALPALWMAAAGLGAAAPIGAQDGPLARTTVRLAAVAPVAPSAALARYWRARPGGAVQVELPFHVGHVGATVQRSAYVARASAQPDFVAWQATVGWGGERPVAGPLRAGALASLGNVRWTFAGERNAGSRRENELVVGAAARLRLLLPSGLEVAALATLDHVFTSQPIRVGALSAAVGYAFRTPAWLRGALE